MIVNEQFCLTLQGGPEVFVEFGKSSGVWIEVFEITQVEPLPDEILDEGVRMRIGHNSLHLLFEHAGLS